MKSQIALSILAATLVATPAVARDTYRVSCSLANTPGAEALAFDVLKSDSHALKGDIEGQGKFWREDKAAQFAITPALLHLVIARGNGAAEYTLSATATGSTTTTASTSSSSSSSSSSSTSKSKSKSKSSDDTKPDDSAHKSSGRDDPGRVGVASTDVLGVTYSGRLDYETASDDGSNAQIVECTVTQ